MEIHDEKSKYTMQSC